METEAAKLSRLPRSFFARPTLEVARELLGRRLVRVLEDANGGRIRLSGSIVEAEAYNGANDKASHASGGRTSRNASMFGPPGHAYIYLIYGMHHCLNVVTEPEGRPAAVLIRALEPLEHIDKMRELRGGRSDLPLASGPGRLCQALDIDRRFDGADLCSSAALLFLEEGDPIPDALVTTGPRVGVRGDEDAVTAPWRFYVRDNPHVSR